MKKSLLYSLCFFTLIFLVKNESLAQPLKIEKSFSGVKTIDADLRSGELIILPSSSGEVELKGYHEENENIKVSVEMNGKTLEIVEKERENGRRDHTNNYTSKWELKVPDGLTINANLGTGEVEITNFNGELDGNCGTGGLTVEGGSGELKWNCGTGSFKVENYSGNLWLNTGTGSFYFENVKGEMGLNTGTGKVELTRCSGEISGNSGTGRVIASDLTITKNGTFNSGTGDVTVKLGETTQADLNVNSGTGDAELILNGHEIGGTLTMVCNERSGKIVSPFDFDKTWTEGSGRNKELHKKKKFGKGKHEVKVGTGTGKAEVSR